MTATSTTPIEAARARLARFPRVPLAPLPTPFEPADRLRDAIGGPRIWLKRDDLTGLALGGNKTRKLEFLLGRALADGVDTVITFGALQSNHARQTAAACARLGLRCELVLARLVDRTDDHYLRSGNRLLDDVLGARVHVVDTAEEQAAVGERLLAEAAADGRTVRSIPSGGSDAVGILGYAAAMVELAADVAAVASAGQVARIVAATSTAGTVAGLVLGAGLLHAAGATWAPTVDAACVLAPRADTEPLLRGLVAEGIAALDLDGEADVGRWTLTDRTLGAGYGIPGPGTLHAVELLARTEGVLLDPVYTGKAFEHLVRAVAEDELDPDADVVFLHTGGAPGLFAYADAPWSA